MDKIGDVEPGDLLRAVLIWTGWGRDAKPRRSESELARHFDSVTASKLVSIIKSLETEFYCSDARHTATDLVEMEKIASQQFKKRYPGIADEIVKALAWCYSYDFK